VFAHIPLWTVYPTWGWGTEDGARALDYLKGFGSVTVLNGHIHQVMQKVEGNVTFHTRARPRFRSRRRAPPPRRWPMKVADDKLAGLLGVASINFKPAISASPSSTPRCRAKGKIRDGVTSSAQPCRLAIGRGHIALSQRPLMPWRRPT